MTGALQGIGKQHLPVINLCIGVVVKCIVTWTLTAVPFINVKGAAIGSATAYLIAMTLDIIAIRKYSGVRFPLGLTIIKPLISALVMGAVVVLVYMGLNSLLGSNGTATLAAIFVGVIAYGLMVLRTKTIRREELLDVSFGRKLVSICDKLRLW